MKHQVSFGWRPPKWLNKVDCCRNDVFLVASGTYFYGGEVGTCEIFKKTVSRNVNISFWLSFLFLKNQNRALKYLVLFYKKVSPLPFVVKSGPFFIQSRLFFIQSGPFLHRLDLFHSPVRPFFIQAGPCWMGPFFKQKSPFPQCFARLQWVPTINHLASLPSLSK